MTDRSGILKNSPLVIMLAAIRFAPWPLLAKKIDEIHDELREVTPLIQKIQILSPTQSGFTGMQVENAMGLWVFLSTDRKFGIHLGQDQLLVFSKEYLKYSDFELKLETCLDILLKHMRFIDVTHAGVRYIDYIKLKDNEIPSNYVAEHLLPASIDGFNDIGSIYAGTYKCDDDIVILRCTSHPDALSVPDDMIGILSLSQPSGSPLQLDTLKRDILLDIDANKAYPESERMEKQAIIDKLKNLHLKANKFFRHKDVCKDYAFKTWKGES